MNIPLKEWVYYLLLLIISKGNFNATVTLHLLWLHIPIDIESLDPQLFVYQQNLVIKFCIPKTLLLNII